MHTRTIVHCTWYSLYELFMWPFEASKKTKSQNISSFDSITIKLIINIFWRFQNVCQESIPRYRVIHVLLVCVVMTVATLTCVWLLPVSVLSVRLEQFWLLHREHVVIMSVNHWKMVSVFKLFPGLYESKQIFLSVFELFPGFIESKQIFLNFPSPVCIPGLQYTAPDTPCVSCLCDSSGFPTGPCVSPGCIEPNCPRGMVLRQRPGTCCGYYCARPFERG